VHVRRTDNYTSITKSPLEAFVSCMRRVLLERGCDFFLATDDPSVEEYMRGHFPSRIFVFQKRFGRNTRESIRDALIDLLLLSRGSLLLASYWSCFSATAASIGGIPSQVVTSDSQEP